jgi:hypothetical protein
MIRFLIEARSIAREDIEPEMLADAMMRGAADDVPQTELYWSDSYAAAKLALDRD